MAQISKYKDNEVDVSGVSTSPETKFSSFTSPPTRCLCLFWGTNLLFSMGSNQSNKPSSLGLSSPHPNSSWKHWEQGLQSNNIVCNNLYCNMIRACSVIKDKLPIRNLSMGTSMSRAVTTAYLDTGFPVNVSIIRVLFSIAACTAKAS